MKRKFDDGWKFFYGDLPPRQDTDGWGGAKARAYSFGAASMALNDSAWRTVELPHDFVLEGDFTRKRTADSDMLQIPEMESVDSRHFAGGSLEMGVGWYRKHFFVEKELEEKRILLHFDGIYRNSTIYINEYFVQKQESGYTGFFMDVTDFINFGGENLIAVRVDAAGREGWWYEGGGIYRHVWLEAKEPVYLEPWGIYVRSKPDMQTKEAETEIRVQVTGRLLRDRTVTVKSVIRDRENRTVGEAVSEIRLPAWDTAECVQTIRVSAAHLWDLEDPYLYRLNTAVYIEDQNTDCGQPASKAADSADTEFGIRGMYFDAKQGFFLNDRHVKIQGLCCHHDHAGVGIAVPDRVQEYRLLKMKEMGANAYRTAHYPPTPELLALCDRMGMLVFEETRRMSSAPDDLERLQAMVKRDRNHPCIFLWGIGNEEIFSQHRPETARTTVSMRMAVQKLDPSRPITSAVVCWDGTQRFENAKQYLPVTKELDVMGFNYCPTAWDDYHERMPKQPIIITEASANSGTRGCYQTDEATGQYYIMDPDNKRKCKSGEKAVKKDTAETQWKMCAERPYLAGLFLWTGLDYKGEPTPLSYPAVNSQFGVLDSCGFRKDNFYYYKSWWSSEPVLHIFPHWNWKGQEGKAIPVYCYSNLEEVELFVNGRSCGRKTMEKNWYLSWDQVIYEPGTLTARGYRNGKEVLTETIETTGAPDRILLLPYQNRITAGSDTAILEVRVVDSRGRVVPEADQEIHVTVAGAGSFLGIGNGNPGSHESDLLPVGRAFHGKCQILVRGGKEAGTLTVKAEAAGLAAAECRVEVV